MVPFGVQQLVAGAVPLKGHICTFFTYISTSRVRITYSQGTNMYLLGLKKVQICPFKGTAPATSCCTPKGTILNPYFSVCRAVKSYFLCTMFLCLEPCFFFAFRVR